MLEKVATLPEIELQWDLADMEDAYDALSVRMEFLDYLKPRPTLPKKEETDGVDDA